MIPTTLPCIVTPCLGFRNHQDSVGAGEMVPARDDETESHSQPQVARTDSRQHSQHRRCCPGGETQISLSAINKNLAQPSAGVDHLNIENFFKTSSARISYEPHHSALLLTGCSSDQSCKVHTGWWGWCQPPGCCSTRPWPGAVSRRRWFRETERHRDLSSSSQVCVNLSTRHKGGTGLTQSGLS